MESVETALKVVLCASSAISAASWAISAATNVPATFPRSRLIWRHEDGSRTDLVETAKHQGKWNKIAAIFASVAAASQTAQAFLG